MKTQEGASGAEHLTAETGFPPFYPPVLRPEEVPAGTAVLYTHSDEDHLGRRTAQALAGAAFALAKFSIDPLYVFTEWVPEVVVELSSIAKRFWSLNDANAAAVRYVSRNYCVLETGRGLLRWGLLALLLGAWMNGVPFFAKRVQMPEINKER